MKRTIIGLVALVSLAMVLVGTSGAQVDMSGVLAIWPLDEGQGTGVADVSGNGITGAFVNDPQWVAGKFGMALSFDGEDDSVIMDSPVVVDEGITEFTLGCWVNPGATQNYGWPNLLSCHNNGVGGDLRGASFEQAGQEANKIYFIAGIAEAAWLISGTTQLVADECQHFVAVREGNVVKHYLNGQLSVEGEVQEKAFAPATDGFRICNWARGETEPRNYKAIVDEVFAFRRALSQDEVANIMDAGLAGTTAVSPTNRVTTTWGNVKSLY